MARPPPAEGPDPRTHRFSRSPPGLVAKVPIPTPTGSPGLRLKVPNRLPTGSPGLQLLVWGRGKRVTSTGEAGGWMTGWPGVSSLSLCCPFSLAALRFYVSCVAARCVFLLRCVLSLRLLFSRYGFHSCHAMPGTMPLLRLVRASSRRFPFPFFSLLFWSCFVSSFPISLLFSPSL